MIRPLGVLALTVFVLVVVRTADWAATRILWLAAAFLVLVACGLALWHRQRMAELRELHNDVLGNWRRLSPVRPWPKACLSCGATAYDWRSVRLHEDTDRSACAAFTARLEAAGGAPREPPWTAVVEGNEDAEEE
jgi:hypothetical protein